jgi:hypothetical protein
MKASFAVLIAAVAFSATAVQAQYYPYNPYDRHSVPANNYARGYNQGAANAYSGMAAGGSSFMNGMAAVTPPVVVAPLPQGYNMPPGPLYAPGAVPLPPVGYGLVPNPYNIPYMVPYVR